MIVGGFDGTGERGFASVKAWHPESVRAWEHREVIRSAGCSEELALRFPSTMSLRMTTTMKMRPGSLYFNRMREGAMSRGEVSDARTPEQASGAEPTSAALAVVRVAPEVAAEHLRARVLDLEGAVSSRFPLFKLRNPFYPVR